MSTDTPTDLAQSAAAPTHSAAPTPARSSSDRAMRRVLLLPPDAERASKADARKAFQTSMAVATVRCLLMYIVLPFVLPLVGFAAGVGPWIGLAISVAAIVAVTMSIRRFWRADHPKRWHYTVLGVVVMVFMLYSMIVDIRAIVG